MPGKKIALIVGSTGMAANGMLPCLLSDKSGEYETVICLARNVDEKTFASCTSQKYIPLACDLNDKSAVIAGLQKIGSPKITNIFWFAEANRAPKMVGSAVISRSTLAAVDVFAPALHGMLRILPQSAEDQLFGHAAYLTGSGRNELNQMWIGNVLDACKEIGAPIENFVLGTGGKYYGMHLGPTLWGGYSCPFEEDKTKAPGILSYFDALDFISERAIKDGFTWNEVRPTFIVGLSPKLTMATQSVGLSLAAYAIILKAQGKDFSYPGSEGSFNARLNLCTSEKIAEVAVWSTQHPNNAYNVVSCPPFTWKEVWPQIAKWFGMEAVGPKRRYRGENSVNVVGKDAPKIWADLQKKHNLVLHDYEALFNDDFLDKSFSANFDSVFSIDKLERDGFPSDRIYEYSSVVELMYVFFNRLMEEKVIPNPEDVIADL